MKRIPDNNCINCGIFCHLHGRGLCLKCYYTIKNNENRPKRINLCACGCGIMTSKIYAMGHSMKILYSGKNNPSNRPEVKEKLCGVNHHNWRGGKRIVKGYMQLFFPKHPHATKQGYIPEHRYIIEKELRRILNKTEIVHHIDGDKLNNSRDNLFLFNSLSEHTKFHAEKRKEARGNLNISNSLGESVSL